jgi:hypothetical protein
LSNSYRKGKQQRRRSAKSHQKTRKGQALFSIERLRARMLVLAYLGRDYSGELALARALARAEERRSS